MSCNHDSNSEVIESTFGLVVEVCSKCGETKREGRRRSPQFIEWENGELDGSIPLREEQYKFLNRL